VVTGIGHETDFTIADFVADLRAPTPTGAAQLVAPSREENDAVVRNLFLHLRSAVSRKFEREMQRLDYLDRRLQHPATRLRAQREQVMQLARRLQRGWNQLTMARNASIRALGTRWQRSLAAPLAHGPELAEAQYRFGRAWQRLVAAQERRLEHTAGALRHLNPEAVLERGYSIVTTDQDQIVQDSSVLTIGQGLRIRFARGAATSSVTSKD
ncbi:MAG: exodeoxyribonuclease VII large subunit, partial [Betaproteobacteria bacterium]